MKMSKLSLALAASFALSAPAFAQTAPTPDFDVPPQAAALQSLGESLAENIGGLADLAPTPGEGNASAPLGLGENSGTRLIAQLEATTEAAFVALATIVKAGTPDGGMGGVDGEKELTDGIKAATAFVFGFDTDNKNEGPTETVLFLTNEDGILNPEVLLASALGTDNPIGGPVNDALFGGTGGGALAGAFTQISAGYADGAAAVTEGITQVVEGLVGLRAQLGSGVPEGFPPAPNFPGLPM